MYVLSKTRQTPADYAAKVIVVDARRCDVRRGLGSLAWGYPLLWLAPAFVFLVLSLQGRMPLSYKYEVDKFCVQADTMIKAQPTMVASVLEAEALRARVSTAKRPRAALRRGLVRLNRNGAASNQRLEALGYRGCAGTET